MPLCGGSVVCLSCYSTLIKILGLFSLVYINSLSVSEQICHRFWRLVIFKREKIPLFIMVSLMWFPCAADKGEISRWYKTSVVINRQHYQFYIFFSYCSLSHLLNFVTFVLIQWTFLIICLFLSFQFVDGTMAILVLNPKSTSQTETTNQTQKAMQRREEKITLRLYKVMPFVCLNILMQACFG